MNFKTPFILVFKCPIGVHTVYLCSLLESCTPSKGRLLRDPSLVLRALASNLRTRGVGETAFTAVGLKLLDRFKYFPYIFRDERLYLHLKMP